MTHSQIDLQDWFGGIDIYLFDQLLKGRFNGKIKVLDAGCGGGRNLTYFLKSGYDVCGTDRSTEAIDAARSLAKRLAPWLPADNFRMESVEDISFPDLSFDAVISSAVLHFARDETHWRKMVTEMWRVLKSGGIFFARLASDIGIADQLQKIEGRRYRLPDGSDRFLVDETMLIETTTSLGAEWLEPPKTVLVHHMRSMTNWCLWKR